MQRSYREKISKKTSTINNTLDQTYLTDIYRTFHPKASEYTFFSSTHETFSKRDHMLVHKTSLNEFKKMEVLSSISSNHNGMKLEMNYKKKTGKYTNMCW